MIRPTGLVNQSLACPWEDLRHAEPIAAQLAATDPLIVEPADTLEHAAQLMAEQQASHAIVVDPVTDEPVGIPFHARRDALDQRPDRTGSFPRCLDGLPRLVGCIARRTVGPMSSAEAPDPADGRAVLDTPAPSQNPHESAATMREMVRAECLQLLAANGVGRIAINLPDWPPMIRPVNYVFDERSQSVVFRSDGGSKLHAALRAGSAAFEIDGIELDGSAAWSVIIVGRTEEVTSASEIARLGRLGLQPWAPGAKPHWVRIRARKVSGRRISASLGPSPADRP